MKAAVVGAGGFVGRALTTRLRAEDHFVLPVVRSPAGISGELSIDDLSTADWPAIFAGVEVVVLTAARVHIMNDPSTDPLAEFRRVNRDGSLAVLRGAIEAGARRFLFVSTVKVNGEETSADQPFRADDLPAPNDPYGVSKFEAEQALKLLAAESDIELTIVRPTLVYGPGVGANFETMMRWVSRGLPIPLGAITNNRRSIVGIDNLVDLLALCLSAPAAANQTFMAADGRDLSTAELLREVGGALGRPARLLSVPKGLIDFAARLLGKGAAVRRLTGSLQVDITKTRDMLGWSPPESIEEGMRRTADAFLGSKA
ncbi:MAG: SDR family oxidoreductase [Sphingosinicella sp.]|nr:SDR family oxidoreductase [Sphingosinicella sp.]